MTNMKFKGVRYAFLFRIAVILTILMPAIVRADEANNETYAYQPLFANGKSWVMWHGMHTIPDFSNDIQVATHAWIEVKVDGFESFEDNDCARLGISVNFKGDFTSSYDPCPICVRLKLLPEYLYGYEDNGKIIVHRNPGPYFDEENLDILDMPTTGYGDPYFDTYFDFNEKEGDKVQVFGNSTLKINREEYVKYGDTVRRVLSCNDECQLFSNKREWIEGIGSNCNCFTWEPYWYCVTPISAQVEMFCLASCSENGNEIYNQYQTMAANGIDTNDIISGVKEIDCNSDVLNSGQTHPCYNLQGFPINNPQKGEVVIQNGKKIVFPGI